MLVQVGARRVCRAPVAAVESAPLTAVGWPASSPGAVSGTNGIINAGIYFLHVNQPLRILFVALGNFKNFFGIFSCIFGGFNF